MNEKIGPLYSFLIDRKNLGSSIVQASNKFVWLEAKVPVAFCSSSIGFLWHALGSSGENSGNILYYISCFSSECALDTFVWLKDLLLGLCAYCDLRNSIRRIAEKKNHCITWRYHIISWINFIQSLFYKWFFVILRGDSYSTFMIYKIFTRIALSLQAEIVLWIYIYIYFYLIYIYMHIHIYQFSVYRAINIVLNGDLCKQSHTNA